MLSRLTAGMVKIKLRLVYSPLLGAIPLSLFLNVQYPAACCGFFNFYSKIKCLIATALLSGLAAAFFSQVVVDVSEPKSLTKVYIQNI